MFHLLGSRLHTLLLLKAFTPGSLSVHPTLQDPPHRPVHHLKCVPTTTTLRSLSSFLQTTSSPCVTFLSWPVHSSPVLSFFSSLSRRRQVEAGLAVFPEPSIPESVLNNYCWWEWRYWPLRKRHCGPSGFHRLFLHVAGLSCPATPFRFWAWNMAFGPVSVLGTTSYTSIWGRRIWCGGRRRRETECGLGNGFFKIIFSLKQLHILTEATWKTKKYRRKGKKNSSILFDTQENHYYFNVFLPVLFSSIVFPFSFKAVVLHYAYIIFILNRNSLSSSFPQGMFLMFVDYMECIYYDLINYCFIVWTLIFYFLHG